MEQVNKLKIKDIENIYRENYNSLLENFLSIQSDFLTGIYQRYNKDLDTANIVLLFARDMHLETLRGRELDLDFDISFDNFWNNHKKVKLKKFKIINISKDTGLPKETARRKINGLIANKTLNKHNQRVSWNPTESYKTSYNKIVLHEMEQVAKLIQPICQSVSCNLTRELIIKELKINFSFYWYHYLSCQLKYLKMWQSKLNDLELLLINLQLTIQSYRHNLTDNNREKDSTISATSISEITGIPRATCIRKLEKLYKLKLIKRDQKSKRFYTDLKNLNVNSLFNTKEISDKTIGIFTNFFLTAVTTLCRFNDCWTKSN